MKDELVALLNRILDGVVVDDFTDVELDECSNLLEMLTTEGEDNAGDPL